MASSHIAEEGDWGTIAKFLTHVFGPGRMVDAATGRMILATDMGLNYIQSMIQCPAKELPTLLLCGGSSRIVFRKILDHWVGGGNQMSKVFSLSYTPAKFAMADQYWLIKTPDILPYEGLRKKLVVQTPAFFHYLQKRELPTEITFPSSFPTIADL